MNRRQFFGGVAAAYAWLISPEAGARALEWAVDPDDALEREVAEYKLSHPGAHPIEFATLHGHMPSLEGGHAIGAMLTNSKLAKMTARYYTKQQGDCSEFMARVVRCAESSPEYYRRVRAFFGLDFRAGWLDRYMAEAAN